MSTNNYQVLARKWRPRNFQTLVGQEHVSKALINALDHERLHHAYLFTGTRGVGKTTIARILSKCLNCETGITSKPCGKCSACTEIDSGRFIDLIEVDAASRTKVEDTRELLDNVQYAPTRGRFKIYLIDEVHMLSGHSFNALLKTLEEPPPHVKFLLATTNPQKLPITILSRCLQFHLKHLTPEQISHYLELVLKEEKIKGESTALNLIAHAAQGSMRDALSLMDQSIAYTHANITEKDIRVMLGTVERSYIKKILTALKTRDGKALLNVSESLAEFGIDYASVLNDLISAFHLIAIKQLVSDYVINLIGLEKIIDELGEHFSPETIQLFYDICVLGQRDLNLVQNKKNAFEMILLRLLAFEPNQIDQVQTAQPETISAIKTSRPKTDSKANISTIDIEALKNWGAAIKKMNLNGMVYALANNCVLKEIKNNHITLILSTSHAALLNNKTLLRLNDTLNQHVGKTLRLKIETGTPVDETPADKEKRQKNEKHLEAFKTIQTDEHIQSLVDKLGANLDPSLISLNTKEI